MWNLEINLEKCKIVVFKKGSRPSTVEKWQLEDKHIEVCSEYKHLGILLTPGFSHEEHFKDKFLKAKQALKISLQSI